MSYPPPRQKKEDAVVTTERDPLLLSASSSSSLRARRGSRSPVDPLPAMQADAAATSSDEEVAASTPQQQPSDHASYQAMEDTHDHESPSRLITSAPSQHSMLSRSTASIYRNVSSTDHHSVGSSSQAPLLEIPEEIYAVRKSALQVLKPLTKTWVRSGCVVLMKQYLV